MDVIGQWLAERCIQGPGESVGTREAYLDYAQYAEHEIGWKLSSQRFRRNLTARGFKRVTGAHGKRMIGGLGLKSAGANGTGPAATTGPDVDTHYTGPDVDAHDAGPDLDIRVDAMLGRLATAPGEITVPARGEDKERVDPTDATLDYTAGDQTSVP